MDVSPKTIRTVENTQGAKSAIIPKKSHLKLVMRDRLNTSTICSSASSP